MWLQKKKNDFTHPVTELLQAKSNDTTLGFNLIASFINAISNARVNINFFYYFDIVLGFDLIGYLIDVISNARVNIDFLFVEWYKHALELAQKVSVDDTKPRVCSKQTDRENHNVNCIAHYHKVSLPIPLTDIVLPGLKRGIEGNRLLFSAICISFHISEFKLVKQNRFVKKI